MTVSRGKRAIALRYALAPACVGVAMLLHVSPVGPLFHPMGLFILGVVAAAWFGGPGPGVLAAFLSAIALPHLIAVTYPLSMAYPLLAGFFDLPRFITLGLTGAAVGWGTGSYRRAAAALRERERLQSKARDELETVVAERTAHLAASEERYARAMQASKDGIWEWNPATDEIFMSDRARHLWAVPDSVAVRTRADLKRLGGFHPEDFQRTEDVIAANRKPGADGFDMEYRVIVPGGGVRWVRSQAQAFPGAEDRPVLVTGSLTDVTERKRAEEALRESQQRYERAMLASNAGIWDWDVVKDEFYVSPRFLEMGGFAPGTTFSGREDFMRRGPIHPEDREKWQRAIRQLFASSGSRLAMELRAIVNGEARWRRLEGICFRDAAGTVVRWTGSTTDITERKRTEEALRRSEERFALALAASSDGIWDWDLVTDEQFFSERAQRIFGLEPGPTVRPHSEWDALRDFHPEDGPRRLAAVERHLAGETPVYEGEWRVRPMGGGEYRWIHTRGLCVRDAAGRPIRMVGAVTDIDERKRIEAALRQSEERYSLALEATEEGHFDVNLDTDEFFDSERLNEIYGFAPGTRFPKRNEYLKQFRFYGNDGEIYHAAVRAAEAKGGPERYEFEYRIVRPSGEVRWLRSRGKVTRDAEGRARRRTGMVADVTARKLAEEALRASEERYALAMEAAGDGHTDWNLVTGEFYISPRLLGILGYAPGTTFADRADWVRRFPFHPEDRKRWEAAIAAHFAGRESKFRMDLRIVVNGDTRWVAFTFIATRDASGKPVRWTGSIADINDTKLAEEALRESQERYALAVAGSDDGVWDCDFAARRVFVSARARELAGMPPGPEMVPLDEWFASLPIHPDDVPRRVAALQAHLAGDAPAYEGELRLRQPDGVYRWRRLHGLCVRDASGNPHRMAGSISDIDARRRAEEALRLSEERYALAMEASEEGHFDWNVQTDEIFASAHMKQLLGLPADTEYRTRSDMHARVRYYPGDRQRLEERNSRVLGAIDAQNELEYRILRGDEVRWLRTSWKIFRDADGAAQRVIGVVSDITERKQAVDTLRVSESRFRTLVELNSNGFWVQDENLRYTSSPFTSDVAGYDKHGMDGRTRWELSGDPTPLSRSWAEHQADLAARRPFRDFEYRRLRPDGKVGYYSASGAPIFDDDGRFKGYYGVASDITERKRVEEELRSRQEMLELAQKSARAIAFEWKIGEGEGENRWSPDLEAMYGFAPGTYDGTFETWKKCVHPEDWPAVKEAVRHAHRTGEVASEYRVVHPDGSVHWLQARGRMLFDAVGNATRMVGFMQDITQRKQAEEELRKMEQELRRAQRLEVIGTLAGGIAHDFNNILGAILGYGEMAMRDAKKGTRLHRDLDSVMAAGERGRALVDRILAFSRSGVGERVPVHVEAVVREALDQVAASLPGNVTVMPRLRAGRAAMLGDSTQVHQVVMNLASNAVQAMPQGGVLRVALETARFEAARPATVGSIVPGDYIVLGVSDTGTGIPEDVLERMFDPFFTTKEVGVGTGLGLSLVHGIVTSVGGAIQVATERGKGTTFTVHLRRSGDATEGPTDEDRPLPRGEGQRVLVVDDEEPLVRLATETLEELGYVALGFTSSAAALEAIRADPQRFDAMITDERMPGMTGSALIRQVRGIRDGIPIVLMTGFVGGGALDRARDAGADEVLKKPLSARELATSLARVLRF